MSAVLRKSKRSISKDSASTISSPALASGATRSDAPAGPMTDLFGREVVPANRSALPEKATVAPTIATSGRIGRGSSASASLTRSLVNRLKVRLDTDGSTLFRMIWKRTVTPSGRLVFRLAASGRSTSGKGFTSWPTPDASVVNEESPEKWEARRAIAAAKHGNNGFGMPLTQATKLASWPTPQSHDERKRGNTEADHHYFPHDLSNASELAAWPTPTQGITGPSNQEREGAENLQTAVTRAAWATPRSEDSECVGAHRGTPDGLHSQSKLATWASPSARDFKDTPGMETKGINPDGSERTRLDQLPRQAALSAGTSAATESIGPFLLNPRFSLWLQGLPDEWASCGERATLSMRGKRRRLSKRT